MAEGGSVEYIVRVRLGTRDPEEITINKTWTVKQLKEHIVDNLGIASGQVDLIFTGKNIDENAKVAVGIVCKKWTTVKPLWL